MSLSILVATPPGYNPGMSAVETGLRLFLRRHRLESSATVYRVHSIEDRVPSKERTDTALLDAAASSGLACRDFSQPGERERFLAADRILYWGDFLHMAQYLRALQGIDSRLRDAAKAAAGPSINDDLLMSGTPDPVLARTCSFGTTLLFNTIEDESSPGYGAALRRFIAGARRLWVRDVISAGKLARLSGDYRTGFWGGDCAQAIDRDGLASLYPSCAGTATADVVGWFVGRGGGSRDVIGDVALRWATALGLQRHWLPWGSRSAFPALAAGEGHPTTSFPSLLRRLLECRMVVTDTYHLGVVAWTLGIPAVMFFNPFSPAAQSVNSGRNGYWRDKREVFYSQYDILDFLIRPEEAADAAALAAREARILAKAGDDALVHAISQGVRGHAQAASADLAMALAGDRAGVPAA
ncbi:hypothetical protein [Cognatiluteimonas telluris]|uniref:hypothetical protein n=1 Tax=Cognatiluteimonas telluris TaxID=1104775 RepID=UPI00140D9805|nr:hypothetical protein [Lysobacter telluris]